MTGFTTSWTTSSAASPTPKRSKSCSQSGKKFDYPVKWGIDLQTEHERYLTEEIFGRPVFVTDYPKEIKAFYMRLNDDNKTVAAADCLVPGIGEIIGGSQREERYDVLLSRIHELGMKEEDYWWYLDLRKYGSCRHAGFGLGFERMVMYLTGVSNIRDVELHPRRTVGNARAFLMRRAQIPLGRKALSEKKSFRECFWGGGGRERSEFLSACERRNLGKNSAFPDSERRCFIMRFISCGSPSCGGCGRGCACGCAGSSA